MQSCKMLGCSFRGVSSIAREHEGPGEDFNNLALAYRMTVLLLREGPGLHPSAAFTTWSSMLHHLSLMISVRNFSFP